MATPPSIRPYTPRRESGTALARRTVGRQALIEQLHAKLLAAATSPSRPHTLLVGPHGAGKTHLVTVALQRGAAEPAFAARVVVVRIDDDAVGLTRFADLLAEVLRTLSPPSDYPAAASADSPAATDLEAAIAAALGDRFVLLVVENLDRVFSDFGLSGQRALRAWVETSGRVMLLATSPRLFPAVQNRDQPWFGGLATHVLPEFIVEEGRALLIRIAEQRGDPELVAFLASPTGKARVAAMAALTGGSPRTWTLLADQVTPESLDALVPAVEDLLEALVPYHQQLLWTLSANERRLVSAVALGPGAATVSDLATATQIEPRTASATLGRLAEAGWVLTEKPTSGDRRTTYYRLRDPLLRLHLQYRQRPDTWLRPVVVLLRRFYDQLSPAGEGEPIGRHVADVLASTPGAHAKELAARLLAAAGGDEAARLSLPPELLPLVAGRPPGAGPVTVG